MDENDICLACGHTRKFHGQHFGCVHKRGGSFWSEEAEVLRELLGPCGCMKWMNEQPDHGE